MVSIRFGAVLRCRLSPSNLLDGVSYLVFCCRSANPRNNLRTEGTFLAVDQQLLNGSWTPYLTDRDYNTWLSWSKWSKTSPFSTALVAWDIDVHTPPGRYRLRHFGTSKSFWGGRLTDFEGASSAFHVEAPCIQEKACADCEILPH